jgi:hypothetical protein
MKLDLFSNSTVVDDAIIRFVENKMGQLNATKSCIK